MKAMNNACSNESVSFFNYPGIRTCQYSVERVDHNNKRSFAHLFSQYEISHIESSESAFSQHAGGCLHKEAISFIVLTNYPASLPVGFIQLYLTSSSFNAAKATIVHHLYVLPEYRNNGAALKLIEAAVKFAIHNKSVFVRLEILNENLSAKKLFESVGFTCQTPASGHSIYSIQFE